MARNGADEIPTRADDTFRPVAVSSLAVDSAQVCGQPKRRDGHSQRRRNDSDSGGR